MLASVLVLVLVLVLGRSIENENENENEHEPGHVNAGFSLPLKWQASFPSSPDSSHIRHAGEAHPPLEPPYTPLFP